MAETSPSGTSLRIGCLGAARIAPAALVRPTRAVADAAFAAIAARDRTRAESFARRHGISRVLDSYDALVTDDGIDAVYIPLPNALHAEWATKALEAGKHVLCEKPLTSNAAEAEALAAVAERTGLVLMEAFHWRYHPLAHRLLEIVGSGELGEVRRLEASFCFPLPSRRDIRWQLDLAGGALMDAGCYAVHIVRTLAGAEPEVVSADARLRMPGVDRFVTADLRFADGRFARVSASMWSSRVLRLFATVEGDRGRLRVFNPIAPHMFHRLTVSTTEGRRREKVRGDSTYTYQLRAFVEAVRNGTTPLTPPSDSVANMRVIDAIYRAAGLQLRGAA